MVHCEHQFIHSISPTFLSAVFPVLFNWVFHWVGQRSRQYVLSKFDPAHFCALCVKFKLAVRSLRAAKNPEQVKSFQFDASQIAVMRFSHTSSTFVWLQNGL
jgi:hypothetical protein